MADGRLIRNGRCDHIPDIRFLKPSNITKVGMGKGKEMYGLVRDTGKLEFLNKPQDYDLLWEDVLSDRNRIEGPVAQR
jgi:glucose-6-phosphate isomerase